MCNESNKNNSVKQFDIYIYHASCSDGLTAVGIAALLKQDSDDRYLTKPAAYGTRLNIEQMRDKRVCFLDFSVSKEVMLEILDVAKCVTVIDHHVSVHAELMEIDHPNFEYVYDINQSGAQLAWDYFMGTPQPYFVKLIGDRDIWTKKYPDADILSLALRVEDWYFSDMLCHIAAVKDHNDDHPGEVDDATRDLIGEGRSYQKYHTYLVKQVASHAVKVKLNDGKEAMAVNCPLGLASDVGNYLAEHNKCGVALMYHHVRGKATSYSIRVAEDCEWDASVYAKTLGGGGHRKAAGYSVA